MRRNTPKRAKRNREADKLRRAFIEQNMNCWLCGSYGTQCHEICSGGSRVQAIMVEENYMALCPTTCHPLVQGWPKARQIALAWKMGEYSMQQIITVCNRMLTQQVDENDVAEWLELFRDSSE